MPGETLRQFYNYERSGTLVSFSPLSEGSNGTWDIEKQFRKLSLRDDEQIEIEDSGILVFKLPYGQSRNRVRVRFCSIFSPIYNNSMKEYGIVYNTRMALRLVLIGAIVSDYIKNHEDGVNKSLKNYRGPVCSVTEVCEPKDLLL